MPSPSKLHNKGHKNQLCLIFVAIISFSLFVLYVIILVGKVKSAEKTSSNLSVKLSQLSKTSNIGNKDLEKSLLTLKNENQDLHNRISALEGNLRSLESKHELHENFHKIENHFNYPKESIPTVVLKEKETTLNIEKNFNIRNDAESASSQIGLGMDTILLIICSNRPEYLDRNLQSVFRSHPRNGVPILISEDGESDAVSAVIKSRKDAFVKSAPAVPVVHLHHPGHNEAAENGYFRLSRHFKWALEQVFSKPIAAGLPVVRRVIILEEDLEIAPDFFEFFAALAPMLDSDPSLLTISAWNDNGMEGQVRDPKQVYRSDFFPGLGWIMTRSLWEELGSKWPRAYWDDWLREPPQRRNRHILRPEICRTYHFGQHGVSNSQYSEYLNKIRLNDEGVEFSKLDLSYLQKEKWDEVYVNHVKTLPVTSISSFRCPSESVKEVRMNYDYFEERGGRSAGTSFEMLARWSGAMDNIKANIPRTAYRGIVSIWKGDCKLHLTPTDL